MSDQYWVEHVEWWSGHRGPNIQPVPPVCSQRFGQPAEKVNDAKVQLQSTPEKADHSGVAKPNFPDAAFD